ncbi:zinc finger, PHD-type, C1-like protein [Tanacetum coccineum]
MVPNVAIPIPISVHAEYPTVIPQDPYLTQTVPHFFVAPTIQNPSTSAQNAYVSQNSITSAQDRYVGKTVSPFCAPNLTTSSQNMCSCQNLANIPFHVPPFAQNPTSTPQNAYAYQTYMNVPTSAQNPPIPQNTTYNLFPTSLYEQPSHGIIHFSHPHRLVLKEIRHKSHPAHPLTLLSSSPYKNANGRSPLKGEAGHTFYCDICYRVVPGNHWAYSCQDCDYGTHLDFVDREGCDDSSGDPNADARTSEQRRKEDR